jgi:hypothetical protein
VLVTLVMVNEDYIPTFGVFVQGVRIELFTTLQEMELSKKVIQTNHHFF